MSESAVVTLAIASLWTAVALYLLWVLIETRRRGPRATDPARR